MDRVLEAMVAHLGALDGARAGESDADAQAAQPCTVARTLVVGVGGTGCLSSQWALRFVRERFGGQRLPLCEFLVIDTTSEASEGAARLEAGDFVNVAGFNANQYFQHAELFDYLDWLPAHKYLPGEINVGAHGRPHIGRLCYFMHREGLVKRAVEGKLRALTHPSLQNRLDAVKRAKNVELELEANVTIHIVSSLFGGTGAGCLLDVASDLRMWCEEMTGHPPRIIGHLVLPEAFQIPCSERVRNQHRATAFSLLCQINHFMGNGEAVVRYKLPPTVSWPRQQSPFDFCCLLDGPSGTTTTDRDRVCRHIGRMIALLATEDAGKSILDRSINVKGSMELHGEDENQLRVYSSYELAAARRPFHQAMGVVLDDAFERFSKWVPEEGDADQGSRGLWTGNLEQIARDAVLDPPTMEAQLTGEVKQEIARLAEQGAQLGSQAAGGRIVEAVNHFLDRSLDRARRLVRQSLEEWLGRGEDPLLDAVRRRWIADEPKVEQLPAFLSAVCAHLDQVSGDGAANGGLQQAAAAIRNLWGTAPANAFATGVRQQILARVPGYARDCLWEAWKLEFRARAQRLKDKLAEYRTRAIRLGRRCRQYLQQHGESGARLDDAAGIEYTSLYAIDAEALKDVALGRGWEDILRHVALGVIEQDVGERTPSQIVWRVFKDSPELRGKLENCFDAYFADYERRSLAEDTQWQQSDDLKKRLDTLHANAEPRWALHEDAEDQMEHIGCLVYPHTLPLHHHAEAHGLESIKDPTYKEVMIVRTAHGAALSDLQNLTTYEKAFRELIRHRNEIAAKSERPPFREADMWLDPKWPVRLPESRESLRRRVVKDVSLVFGLMWGCGRIKADPDGWVTVDDGGRKEMDLGPNLATAFDTLCTRKNARFVRETLDRYCRDPERGRLVDEALQSLNELEQHVAHDEAGKRICRRVAEVLQEKKEVWAQAAQPDSEAHVEEPPQPTEPSSK